MLHTLQFSARRLATETRGAEIAEAAAVLPLMFMMLLGIFWFGQAFSIYGAITRAAQEGARAGSAPICATCTGANLISQSRINASNAAITALTASRLDSNLTIPGPTPPFISCSTSAATCDLSANANMCIQAPVQLTSTGVCGISVSFQYPFQFWLPFTSLNKQRIWISASARMRLEPMPQ
jgi:Flp pilus assembly protein TadG